MATTAELRDMARTHETIGRGVPDVDANVGFAGADHHEAGAQRLAFEMPRDTGGLATETQGRKSVGLAAITRDLARPALATFAACFGVVLVSGGISGLASVARAVGVARPRRFDMARLGRAGIGTLVIAGGAMAMAGLRRIVGRPASIVAVPVAAFAIDRFAMHRDTVGAMRQELGPIGLVAKYGAMGVASALVR